MKNFDCSTVDKPTPDLKSSEVTRNTLTNETAIHDYQMSKKAFQLPYEVFSDRIRTKNTPKGPHGLGGWLCRSYIW